MKIEGWSHYRDRVTSLPISIKDLHNRQSSFEHRFKTCASNRDVQAYVQTCYISNPKGNADVLK